MRLSPALSKVKELHLSDMVKKNGMKEKGRVFTPKFNLKTRRSAYLPGRGGKEFKMPTKALANRSWGVRERGRPELTLNSKGRK